MAQQDYVAKKRNNKKSPYKKSAPAAEGLSVKAKLIILFTCVLIGAFSYGLWYLKHDERLQQPMPLPTEPTETKATGEVIPEPPKEKWSYMEQLKNKKVEEGHYEVEQKGPYQMQCGSFKTEAQANELKARIAFAGIESQVRKADGKNGTWYKVILGPYPQKRKAESDKHKLRRSNINYCQIWNWR